MRGVFSVAAMRGGALPAAILALILLMVVPVAPLLLDVFFVFNLGVSVAILMVALNARKPLDFSAFPTVLLFATLFRLALNVASTRVVLVHGHEGPAAAGHVIEAFGAFLIGGNFAVGLFVFAILVIINMIVVTKGAGRVSEVSARFTLDALPGKQMAIDADLNAGLVTPDEARARRAEVATEADFYGAMDGSSKFVKGDAVAGLLILGVNILAGFALGMISHGLTAGEAAQSYVSLAVGDALVAQVPSLLLSIAAAAIVTRVTSTFDLAGQIGSQFADSRTWVPVAAILFLIGCIPAMPQTILWPAAAVAGLLGWSTRKPPAVPAAAQEEARADPTAIEWGDVSDHAAATLELGFGLVHLVDPRQGAPLVQRLTGVRKQLSQAHGFVVPPIRVRDALDLAPNRYRLTIGGVEAGAGEVEPGAMLALDTDGIADHDRLAGRATRDPSFGIAAKWIAPGLADLAVAEGWLVVDPVTVIATHASQCVGGAADRLFSPDETRALVAALREHAEQLVDAVTPAPLSTPALTAVFQALLADGLPLAHPRPIFAALAAATQRTLETDALVDAVREALGGLLVARLRPAGGPLPIVALAAELEATVLRSVAQTPERLVEPALGQRILDELDAVRAGTAAGAMALIVQPAARRAMRQLLGPRADIAVLALRELPETQAIDVVAVIGGDDPVPSPSEHLALESA